MGDGLALVVKVEKHEDKVNNSYVGEFQGYKLKEVSQEKKKIYI